MLSAGAKVIVVGWALLGIGRTEAEQPAPDLVMYNRIREEGSKHSQVMRYAAELIDGIGPRLTGSENLERATEWARKTLVELGCTGVRLESWGEFGLGWKERNIWLRMTQPDAAPLIGRAAPWSPATYGPVTGEVMAVRGFSHESEFDAYRGKLENKIVLLGTAPSPPEVFPIRRPLFERLSDKQLAEFAAVPYQPPEGYQNQAQRAAARFDLMEKTGRFFAAEKVAAVLVPSGNNENGGASGGTIHVDTNYTFGWYVYQPASVMRVPLIVTSIEHYGRLSRLLQRGGPVRVELNVDTEFRKGNQEGFNVFGELPGVHSRQKDEAVMLAAHLDSWAAGAGATDDGAGVIIALEAMRILNALAIKPNRAIRLALWTGEEQGSLGSREYVKRHLATVPLSPDEERARVPEFMRKVVGPVVPKADHGRISAVYTLDAGGGKIRGISTANPNLAPIFRNWLAPLADLGVTMISGTSDCGGDCWTFQQVGIPTPSFKQDPLDYNSLTHHTNMDTYEHLLPEDLRQAAIVVATVVYNTAMYRDMLPRLPLN